ncbi:MAG: hypothetical protein ACRCT8_08905, partial [Lacipirellulaceae bacterium]
DTCYSQEVMDMNMDFLMADRWPRNRGAASGPIDGARVLEHCRPDYVLLDRRYRPAVDVLFQASRPQMGPHGGVAEWSLLYQDATSQVWGRREVVDEPASDRYVPAALRTASDYYTEAELEFPALPHAARWPTLATLFDAPAASEQRASVSNRAPSDEDSASVSQPGGERSLALGVPRTAAP